MKVKKSLDITYLSVNYVTTETGMGELLTMKERSYLILKPKGCPFRSGMKTGYCLVTKETIRGKLGYSQTNPAFHQPSQSPALAHNKKHICHSPISITHSLDQSPS